MKATPYFLLVLMAYASSSFGQVVTGYPAYDNVHLEHNFQQRNSQALIDQSPVSKITYSRLSYCPESISSFKAFSKYSELNNMGLLSAPHNVRFIPVSQNDLPKLRAGKQILKP